MMFLRKRIPLKLELNFCDHGLASTEELSLLGVKISGSTCCLIGHLQESTVPESNNQSELEENLTVSPAHAVDSAPPLRMRELGADGMADL